MKYLFLIFTLLGLLHAADGGIVLSSAQGAGPGNSRTASSVAGPAPTTQSPFCAALTDGTPVPKRN